MILTCGGAGGRGCMIDGYCYGVALYCGREAAWLSKHVWQARATACHREQCSVCGGAVVKPHSPSLGFEKGNKLLCDWKKYFKVRTFCLQAEGEAAAGWQSRKLVVAAGLVDTLKDKLGVALRVLATVKGAELEGCTYSHPLFPRTSPVVVGGDYITTDSGARQ